LGLNDGVAMKIHEMSAVELCDAMQGKELSSVEIVNALHARTDEVDGAVHGFVHQFRETALSRAKEADTARSNGEDWGPLHGLPITVKENIATEGVPQTLGVRAFEAEKAKEDAVIVQQAKSAGAIVLGKSNIPMLLLSFETHNDIWGTTNNPWDTRRVPGGSSGGEAALISTGQSPIGLGSDIGGSIRIPCAWCGITGIKPTFGRWSVKGSRGGIVGQEVVKAQVGPMARSVADLVLMMKAMDPVAQHQLDPRIPGFPVGDPSQVDLAGLRVGLYEDDGVFGPAASVRRGVQLAAKVLADAGATIVPYTPPESWQMVQTYFGALSADGTATLRNAIGGQPVIPQLKTLLMLATMPNFIRGTAAGVMRMKGEPRVATVLESLGKKSVERLWELTAQRSILQQAEAQAWEAHEIDLLIGPSTVTPAALHRETGDWALGAWHTMRYNLLDLPAGVLPITLVQEDETVRADLVDRLDKKAAMFEQDSVGMPVAAQIVGKPWRESQVLAAMAAIEAGVRELDGWPATPIDPRVRQ